MQNLNDGIKKAGSLFPSDSGCISKGFVSSLALCSDVDSKLSDYDSQEKTGGRGGDVQELPTPAVYFSAADGDEVEDPQRLIGGSYKGESCEILENRFDSVIFHEITHKPDKNSLELFSVKCDWLSVTVPPEVSKALQRETVLENSRGGTIGFSKTQDRLCIAGSCTRKYEPVNKTCELFEKWGGFESWDFRGGNSVSDIYYRLMTENTCRPTRIDIAFDYLCPSDYMPKDFINTHRSVIESQGYIPGLSGNENTYTSYLGTRKSGLYLRIYRKDIEDSSYKQFGAVLRVELEVRKHYAVDLWDYYLKNGREASFRFAAAHINRMCGFKAIPDDLPELPVHINTQDSCSLEKTYHLINQWFGVIDSLIAFGVDMSELVSLKAGKASRVSKGNSEGFRRGLQTYGTPDAFIKSLKYRFA